MPNDFNSRYVTNRNALICFFKKKHVHSSIIHTIPKLETTHCSSTGKWRNELLYIQTMVYNGAMKRSVLQIHAAKWMNHHKCNAA